MTIGLFFRGLLIGLCIAAPVGPIGVLCIRRTLAHGRIAGLISGLGAATADAIYGSIAGFGLTAISASLLTYQTWFRLIGGLFLCYLGFRTALSKPATHDEPVRGQGLMAAYVSTLFLTLTNPVTILAFAAMFAGAGLAGAGGNYLAAAMLVAGVFAGSALWWFVLSGGISLFRAKCDVRALRWLNRISGVMILGFGLAALVSLAR